SARSIEQIGIALEGKRGGKWETLGEASGTSSRLAAPVSEKETLRLRVWSLDRRGNAVDIAVASAAPEAVSESRLAAGVAAAAVAGFTPPTALVHAALDRPGTFRAEPADGVWWSAARDRAMEKAGGAIEATGKDLWLARDAGSGSGGRIAARRLRLDAKT